MNVHEAWQNRSFSQIDACYIRREVEGIGRRYTCNPACCVDEQTAITNGRLADWQDPA
jgi:hypothetical protein